MSKRSRSEFWVSSAMNMSAKRKYYDQLMELSLAMFKWNNVPDTVDTRFLELTLFADGKSLYFNDDVLGNLALRVAIYGGWNVYNIPLKRRAYASNHYQAERTIDDSVIIYNNLIRTNTMPIMENFALRLWNLDGICDINCNAQKTPILIICDENLRLTMEQLYMQYQGNQPVIFGDKRINENSIQVLTTNAPFVADKVLEYKTNIWNEALTFLGINNITTPKKERAITNEINNSQGAVYANRYSRLTARQKACEAINKMFGTNISVEYRNDAELLAQQMMKQSLQTQRVGGKNDE